MKPVKLSTLTVKKSSLESNDKGKSSKYEEIDDIQALIDGLIDENFILKATGATSTLSIKNLEIKIDTYVQSIHEASHFLPNLMSLCLDKSVISSVRDLGSGFKKLMSLSLNECGLHDIDGIGVLIGLVDISLCDNFLTDLSPLSMHENLRLLNVSSNKLSDFTFADALSTCPKLTSLFIKKNPIARVDNIQNIVPSIITTLELLDGSPVDKIASSKVTYSMILEATNAMHLLEEEMDDEKRLETNLLGESGLEVAVSSPRRSFDWDQPSSSPKKLPGAFPDTGSELTHGSNVVLAGNMAAAMRRRRNEQSADQDVDSSKRGTSNKISNSTYNNNSNNNSKLNSSNINNSNNSNNNHFNGGGNNNNTNDIGTTSALAVLDAALKGHLVVEEDPTDATSGFTGEGDITESVLRKLDKVSVEDMYRSLGGGTSIDTRQVKSNGVGSSTPSRSKPTAATAKKSTVDESPRSKSRGSPRSPRGQAETTTSNTNSPRSSASGRGAKFGTDRKSPSPGGTPARGPSTTTRSVPAASGASSSSSRPVVDSSVQGPQGLKQRPDAVVPSAPFKVPSDRPPSADAAFLDTEAETSVPITARSDIGYRRNDDIVDPFPGEDVSDEETLDDLVKYYYTKIKKKAPADITVKDSSMNKSIVHLDMVRRGSRSRPGSGLGTSRTPRQWPGADSDDDLVADIVDIDGDDESDSDSDQDVSHAARFRLMSASGTRPRSSAANRLRVDSSESARQRIDSRSDSFSESRRPGTGDREQSDSPATNEDVLGIAFNAPAVGRPMTAKKLLQESQASRSAGKNLGFDLLDSLAAIDQWVTKTSADDEINLEATVDRVNYPGMIEMNLSSSNLSLIEASGISEKEQPKTRDRKMFDDCSSEDEAEFKKIREAAAKQVKSKLIAGNGSNNNKMDSIDGDIVLTRDDIFKMFKQDGSEGIASDSMDTPSGIALRPGSSGSGGTGSGNNSRNGSAIGSRKSNNSNIAGPLQGAISLPANKSARSPSTSVDLTVSDNTSVPKAKSNNRVISSEKPPMMPSEPKTAKNNKAGKTTSIAAEPTIESPLKRRAKEPKLSSELGPIGGQASTMSDDDLVELLKCPPKSIPVLRTKGSFQAFFKGIPLTRMQTLLERAYANVGSEAEQRDKVSKRLELLKDVADVNI